MATAARPPEIDVARVRRYCQRRVPPHARQQVRLETVVRGSAITIIERRAPWREDFGPEWSRLKVAQLRYDHGSWTLHWADRNGRWLRYPDLEPSPRLDDLLTEIDRRRLLGLIPSSRATHAMTVGPNGLEVVMGINRRPAAQISTRGELAPTKFG